MIARLCPVCGADLAGRRADAIVCGAACRRERSRVRALLAGQGAGPYATLDQYNARACRRAKTGHTSRQGV